MNRLPSVKRVVLIASPIDFADCSAGAPSTFDVRVADRYVFKHEAPYKFYLDYFDPGTLLKNAVGLQNSRSNMSSYDSLVMNGYGDGPLEPKLPRELLYGTPSFDPTCFAALRRTAADLGRRSTPFEVVLTPLNPAWRDKFDQGGRYMGEWQRRVIDALTGTGGSLIFPGSSYEEGAFLDAIHLRWSRTARFTRLIVDSRSRPRRLYRQ